MVTAGSLEPGSVPRVLDLPLLGRQDDASHLRHAISSDNWTSVARQDADPQHPIGVQAAAREWPAAVDAPAIRNHLRLACRRNRPRKGDIRSIGIHTIV